LCHARYPPKNNKSPRQKNLEDCTLIRFIPAFRPREGFYQNSDLLISALSGRSSGSRIILIAGLPVEHSAGSRNALNTLSFNQLSA
jgi:hypothetical protein